ncbi:hypothetical protein [Streptomyces lomondensis]|uniref:Glycoside hydrolase family 65 n=1 Tax=Streptomyces lomondensis TaxID=68229 RepID=A0ABQ2XRN3_9ACTN|nr:hypothetical protein [Streptomyces lomondensis]MCF0080867.1 hypothetical protein [Streptomyces lomondensis]GGX30899.1 hypothetical protein GCM10010383_71540 [Streptomyces lomondensis]
MIDRESVVRRHTVELTRPDPSHVLTVGNGDFAYTADITGMQTFTAYHDQATAWSEGRLAVNTATMSTWGWHAMPNPEGFVLADAMSTYDTPRGPVQYPDKFDMTATFGGQVADEYRAGTWLHGNPHRLDLGRIGLLLRPSPDAAPEADPGVLTNPRQRLDLWTGVLTSVFEYAGHEVRVTTVADPHHSRVAFRIESDLLADGRAAVAIRFPYASDGFFQTSDWTAPDHHRTSLDRVDERTCVFDRVLDDTSYSLRLGWSTRGQVEVTDDPHEYVLSTPAGTLELVAGFSPGDGGEAGRDGFDSIRAAAQAWWHAFWTSGAAIDLSGSTDPRAHELERRVVLSQYLTAVNCSGMTPPQETGLVTNSWHGKFHLEMHFWHAAHFAAWGRPELLEPSLEWYLSILDTARDTARRQQYDGARWPKQVGPDGRESPSDIGSLLVWQQPHPLYLLELLYRGRADESRKELVERFAELVEETARFMASFVEDRDGTYHLPAPLVPAQEFYDARSTEDPTFELAYWWWGLEIAQRWRERLGLPRHTQWRRVQDGLAPPRRDRGVYAAIGTEPYLRRDDHPSLLCALGVVPRTPLIDPEAMEATLLDVRDDWDWNSAWGWDFPVMAMTATRLGRPDLAIDMLLTDTPKNQYAPTGHTPQIGSLLPIYLPAGGALLAAVSLMVAGWDGAGDDVPGFPKDGSWTIRHEGFTPWP